MQLNLTQGTIRLKYISFSSVRSVRSTINLPIESRTLSFNFEQNPNQNQGWAVRSQPPYTPMRSIFNPYLEIHFRLVLSERWNSSEQRFPLNPGLREGEEKSNKIVVIIRILKATGQIFSLIVQELRTEIRTCGEHYFLRV